MSFVFRRQGKVGRNRDNMRGASQTIQGKVKLHRRWEMYRGNVYDKVLSEFQDTFKFSETTNERDNGR